MDHKYSWNSPNFTLCFHSVQPTTLRGIKPWNGDLLYRSARTKSQGQSYCTCESRILSKKFRDEEMSRLVALFSRVFVLFCMKMNSFSVAFVSFSKVGDRESALKRPSVRIFVTSILVVNSFHCVSVQSVLIFFHKIFMYELECSRWKRWGRD